MGAIFSKPKAPKIEPPKELPDPDDQGLMQAKRRQAARRLTSSGIASTRISERASKPLGQ